MIAMLSEYAKRVTPRNGLFIGYAFAEFSWIASESEQLGDFVKLLVEDDQSCIWRIFPSPAATRARPSKICAHAGPIRFTARKIP